MAKKSVCVSDFSGKELDDKSSCRIMLTYNEPDNLVAIVADASTDDSIVKAIEAHGKTQARRGRRTAAPAPVKAEVKPDPKVPAKA